MNIDDLPGEPFNVKMKCPTCGWGFDFGMRRMAEFTVEEEEDDERGVTTCSQCLTNFDFRVDGTDVRVITPGVLAQMSPKLQMLIHKGQFIAWLAQQVKNDGRTH